MSEETTIDNPVKKSALDSLSREELLDKYHNALGILKKAKVAKDAIAKENSELKERIEKAENRKVATDEIVENLTQQKLGLVTSLEEARQGRKVLEEKLVLSQKEVGSLQLQVSDLDTSNESYKRQVNRLTDENEQLLTHLDTLEKQIDQLKNVGIKQQEQLLILEKANQGQGGDHIIKEKEPTDLEATNTKLKEKIKLYHKKMVKFAADIKDLKNTKNLLLQNFKSYTEQVEYWKKQLNDISNKLIQDVNNCESEKSNLKSEVEKLNSKISTLTSNESKRETEENKKLKEMESANEELNEENEKLKTEVTSLNNRILCFDQMQETLKMNITRVSDNSLEAELAELKKQLNETTEHCKSLEENNHKLNALNRNLTETFEGFERKLKEAEDSLNASNKELKDSEKISTEKINSLDKELSEKNSICEQMQREFTDLSERYQSLVLENMKNLQIAEDLQSKFCIVKTDCNRLQEELKDKISENEWHVGQNSENIKRLDQLQMDYNILKEELSKTEVSKNETLSLEAQLAEESRVYKEDISSKESAILEMQDKLAAMQNELENVKNQLEAAKSSNGTLNNEVNMLKDDNCNQKTMLENLQQNFSVLENKAAMLTKENQELLSDMNDMNQALKERGETISKQQVYCEELIKKAQQYEDNLNKQSAALVEKENQMSGLQQTITDLKVKTNVVDKENNEMQQKDDVISQLQMEIQGLKDKLNNSMMNESCADSSYADSETMSTSTISRMDEMNRLKDLEGPWEERYGKLRALAVKQKGKIRELTAEISKEQSEKADLQSKCSNALKTIQTMQTELDKLHDDLEASKKECNVYIKKLDTIAVDISKNKQIQANDEDTISKLKADMENLIKEKNSVEEFKKQAGVKFQNFKKVLENNEAEKKQLLGEIDKLKAEIDSKEKQLKSEMEKHNKTRNSLVESNNECKKQSVLNLEMQDYERSIKDLSGKLEKKQELITKLKGQVDTQKSSLTSLKDQNKLMEDQVATADKEVESCKSEVVILKGKITELSENLTLKDAVEASLTEKLETVRLEYEELSSQLTCVAADNEKSNSMLKNERELLRSQNLGLEQKLREVQDVLRLKEDELWNVHEEYKSYKVRAQSVLRQNQTRDIGLEEKLVEESASLKAKVDILNHEIVELKSSVEKLNSENLALLQENDKAKKASSEINQLLKDTQMQLENLQKKYQETIGENTETIRNLKVHAETLSTCYRQQVAEQEVRHNREIIELQSKISKSTASPEIPTFMVPSMPREEGEGSESVESSTPSIHPIPLERLLSSDQDSSLIKKQLAENESKVTHLTALLADTEQDLVKHVQMNKMLKEEIRRQQRSVEREQHAENLEYLKNVIFKFIMLNNGDERTRLVPVLTTILKLSPLEIQKLNQVVKSDKGWSNYLPIWSSPKPE